MYPSLAMTKTVFTLNDVSKERSLLSLFYSSKSVGPGCKPHIYISEKIMM